MLRKQRLAEKEDKYLLLSLQEPLRLKTACCSLRASTLNPKFCISPANGHVCFTPESGHVRCNGLCLPWAKRGHVGTSLRAPIAGRPPKRARSGYWLGCPVPFLTCWMT